MMNLRKRKKPEQTITRTPRAQGSGSAPVFSYYSRRSQDSDTTTRNFQSDTGKRSPRIPWVKYMPSILSLLIVTGALVYLTTLSTKPRVVIASNPAELLAIQPKDVYEA